MELKIIKQDFSICKVEDLSQIDYSDEFCFISKTDEELSTGMQHKFSSSKCN